MPVDRISASLGLPFGLGQVVGEWVPDTAERKAAWDMYVELITRVTVVPLSADEGLIREALTSYYSLFDTTRRILKEGGPDLARPSEDGAVAFGHLAVAVLNKALRPLLAKWHPLLEDHENSRPKDISRSAWEQQWALHDEARTAISEVRTTLESYAGILGEVCDAKSLLSLAT